MLTEAKHQLRDWIESRMAGLKVDSDPREFERSLNLDLKAAGLFERGNPRDWFEQLGSLAPVRVERNGAFLVVETSLGIECGYDMSAYLYGWSSEGWRRVWQNEQNTYTKDGYEPQTIKAVRISPYSRSNEYLVLTLGFESWCASNWHNVYYRLFRLGPDPMAPPLVDGSEWTFMPEDTDGAVAANDALIEFNTRSIDTGILIRTAVRHYAVDQGKVTRVDPYALRPRDFVDEWLTQDWIKAAAYWSEPAHRAALRDLHQKLYKSGGTLFGNEFIFPTMHCPATPDLWQVGIDFSNPPLPIGSPPNGTYFLVRWQPPYRFRMVDVSTDPFPGCTQPDRAADEAPHTLFPNRQ